MTQVIDMTGRRFGDLKVLHIDNERSSDGTIRWIVKCLRRSKGRIGICGRVLSVRGNLLRSGGSTSCGDHHDGKGVSAIDHAGQKIGNFKVINRVGTKHKSPLWLAECEHGRRFQITHADIGRGKTLCPCISLKALDLVGRRFGRGVVEKRIGRSRRRGALWQLKCDCGKRYTSDTGTLRYGAKQSCGCLMLEKVRENGRKKLQDLTGQKFGRGTVSKRVGTNKNAHPIWELTCDCGQLYRATSSTLKRGFRKSCGCRDYLSKDAADGDGLTKTQERNGHVEQPPVSKSGQKPGTQLPSATLSNLPKHFTVADLAAICGSETAAESFLRRLRKDYDDCYTEVDQPRKNEPRFVYRKSDLLQDLEKWLTRRTSDGRKK